MNIDEEGIAFLKEQEGFRPTPYDDSAGHASIGFGHKLIGGEQFTQITEEQADELLRKDLAPVEKALTDLIEVDVSQCEFNALCSFTFNEGIGAFRHSTLLKYLNQADYHLAACELCKWVYITVGGAKIVSPGLVRRRHAETDLFNHL